MSLSFAPSDRVRSIRRRIDHPIVDADGHLMEFLPLVVDLVREVGGGSVAGRFQAFLEGATDPHSSRFASARVFWALPERNTLDRMTATLPRLLYRRTEELGIDFALLYPTLGLTVLAHPDDELRRAAIRALNTYYAEAYGGLRDRLEPVALIPMFTPQEALAELDHAVGVLGLKAIVTSAVIPRSRAPDGTPLAWIDTLGHDSLYDYDPVWARCAQLRVAPAFHGLGYGWGSRFSRKNYVYNHVGSFAAAQEAACRSLLLGGVPRRFPQLRFAFLEGGVAWGAQLLADLLGHYAKRNREQVAHYDPRRFDLELCRALLDEFAEGRIAERRAQYEEGAARLKRLPAQDPRGYDDFAESGLTGPHDILDIFTRQFYFGCEADDPLNALAFRSELLPERTRLNALFASDIGHWDVPDMREVLPEAWELVENGQLSPEDFRELACGNVVRMLTALRPDFFEGTAVADAARRYAAPAR
jgi:predicted TIM-barrel fold metal-dependent hydrolase